MELPAETQKRNCEYHRDTFPAWEQAPSRNTLWSSPSAPSLGEPWQGTGRGAAVQLNLLYLISVHVDVSCLTLFTATRKISHIWKSWFCQKNSSEFLGDLKNPPYFMCVNRATSLSVPSPDPQKILSRCDDNVAQQQLCSGSLTPLTFWHSCASCDHLGHWECDLHSTCLASTWCKSMHDTFDLFSGCSSFSIALNLESRDKDFF